MNKRPVLNGEDECEENVRSYNVGTSDYSTYNIQPWSIWEEYKLNPWDADVVKRILRKKSDPDKTVEESRVLDYEKIIHICKERIRQIKIKGTVDHY